METTATHITMTVRERIEHLRRAKLEQTLEKQRVIGAMDYDDWAIILPPEDRREVVRLIGASGAPITDVRLKGYKPVSNHPSGGFFGPAAVGANFRALLEMHPVYIDPVSSLAGGYMTNFFSYRDPHWNPDLSTESFRELESRYQLALGIGGVQHFCQDLAIGLELGWGGLTRKIASCRAENPDGTKAPFYDGLDDVVTGIQDWIRRTAQAAEKMARKEKDPQLADNLREMAAINHTLVTDPPKTFREACQWILWYQMVARMYDGSGSLGCLDQLLTPYYEAEHAAGTLSDEEATFHIACHLVRDTAYIQLGGYDAQGHDTTNAVSYLVLEALDWLKIPANAGVCVGEGIDPGLLMRGVRMQFDHKNGNPKFLGLDRTAEGFARNGYPLELGWNRVYAGCHWCAIPGREYTMNDIIKVNLAVVLDVALRDMLATPEVEPGIDLLWTYYERHLRAAVDTIARAVDFHLAHQGDVFPELVLDLLCHGTIERGLDAASGGVDFYDIGVDAAGLANTADSLAAMEQRVATEKRLGWSELLAHLDASWSGSGGETARQLMKTVPRYGSGGSRADAWARRVSELFTTVVREKRTPEGHLLIPGLFSWALSLAMGKTLGATPDGRRAGDPIAHGPNPTPGFRKDGAPTALAVAVAAVQSGYGQTGPMQMDLDPGLARDEGGLEKVAALIRGHFRLGGTQINLNVMDAARVVEAAKDPARFPELVVRVTGFSAYFASLSEEMRGFVVNRILREESPAVE